jgi:tRNA A-37 threonylcarbamoyl transferase component Bud32
MDTPPQDPLIGQVLGDRYRVLSAIGTGGMANVYLGEHQLLRKKVAIKVLKVEVSLDATMAARFETEAVAAARLDHPNCVGISDFGRTPRGQYFLVMELIEGQPVSDLLRGNQRMPWSRALPIIRQVLRGLARAHELGIVHRDLKPSNIMLTSKPGAAELVKIIDFGIAKLFGDAADVAPQVETANDIVFGTADYMPPERLRGERNVDERSDLYAVGVSLYEMVCGRRPFVAAEAYTVAKMALTQAPEPPSRVAPEAGIPAALEVAILRALEKDPGRRFQSAREFLAAIEAPDLALMAPDLPRMATTSIAPVMPTAMLPRPNRKVAIGLGAAAAVLVAAALMVTCMSRGDADAKGASGVLEPLSPEAQAAQLDRLAGEAAMPGDLARRQRATDLLVALGHDEMVPLADKLTLDLAEAPTCEARLEALAGLEKLKDPATVVAVRAARARADNDCLKARATALEHELAPAEIVIEDKAETRPKAGTRRTGTRRGTAKPADSQSKPPPENGGGGHFGHFR